ncbi:MAG: PqqD family peptide modification chaperone [Candidatus Woesearchaeota archaeon]
MIFKNARKCFFAKTIFAKFSAISWRWEDDQGITICTNTFSKYIMLNESAAILFSLCDGRNQIGDIYQTFSKFYDGFAENDIKDMLEIFIKLHIIVTEGSGDILPVWTVKPCNHLKKKKHVPFRVEMYPKIMYKYRRKGQTVRFKYPLLADIELLYNCNFDCKECYNESRKQTSMCTKKVYDIIDKVVQARCLHVTLLGGEPLLRQDIFDIVKYCKKKGLLVKIITNGVLLTERIVRKLEGLHLDIIVISIDSLKKSVNSLTRANKQHNLILKNIKIVANSSMAVAIGCTLNRKNLFDIFRFYNFAITNHIETVRFLIIVPYPKKEKVYSRLRQVHMNYFFLLTASILLKLMMIYNRIVREPVHIHFSSYPYGYCAAKSHLISISPTGELSMCPHCSYTIDNISGKDIIKIWRSRMFSRIVDYRSYRFPCNVCYKVGQCAGFCRAKAYAQTGDILGSQPDCPFAKVYIMLAKNSFIRKMIVSRELQDNKIVWL